MLVLTLPIFVPIVSGLGIDLIWFGVLVVLTLEMGLISPPVGINVFIVKSVAPRVPLADIFRGVFPFWLAMLVTLLILVAVPALSLYLPTSGSKWRSTSRSAKCQPRSAAPSKSGMARGPQPSSTGL